MGPDIDLDRDKYPVLHIFDQLEPAELAQVTLLHLKPRDALIREHEMGRMDLYLILEGVCINDMVYQSIESLFVARKVLPGEFIGLQEIISHRPTKRVTSVYAKTPVLALEIPGDAYLRWQIRHPGLYNYIINSVLSSHLSERILNVNCAVKDSLMAGAYYFHYLYQAYALGCHPRGYEGAVVIWDTRKEIGLALSRALRSVNRIISEFRRLGLISVDDKGTITIDKKQAARLEEYRLCRL